MKRFNFVSAYLRSVRDDFNKNCERAGQPDLFGLPEDDDVLWKIDQSRPLWNFDETMVHDIFGLDGNGFLPSKDERKQTHLFDSEPIPKARDIIEDVVNRLCCIGDLQADGSVVLTEPRPRPKWYQGHADMGKTKPAARANQQGIAAAVLLVTGPKV